MNAEWGTVCTPPNYYDIYVKKLNKIYFLVYVLINEDPTEDYLASGINLKQNAKNIHKKL